MILALHACCSRRGKSGARITENGRNHHDDGHHPSSTVTKVNIDEAWWLGVTSPPLLQWQTRDSSGAIIACQLETSTDPASHASSREQQYEDDGTMKHIITEAAEYVMGFHKPQYHSTSELPTNNQTEPYGKNCYEVNNSTRFGSTYSSQSEVLNDIYKKLPNRIDNINGHSLPQHSRNQFPESLNIPISSGPTMHLLPKTKEHCSQRPKTPTIVEEEIQTLSATVSKDVIRNENKFVDQTTQTHLSIPINPRQMDVCTTIKEIIKGPKVSVEKAPLGVPMSIPCQLKVCGSPISPRQSSRKKTSSAMSPNSSRTPKSPKSPKDSSSQTSFFRLDPTIFEKDETNTNASDDAKCDNSHTISEKRKVVWTNQSYNEPIRMCQTSIIEALPSE